jgi:bifunctional non-homologous end joining protein LigD
MTVITAGRHRVELSNPDKVLFPDDGITKAELAEYYAAIAVVMVPHVRGRPAMLQRFPDGITRSGFVQKEVASQAPDWVHVVEITKQRGTVNQLTIDSAATLVWLADQACVTPHVWLSRVDRIDSPDLLIFDLDPPGDDPAAVRSAALMVRELLRELGMDSFVKSTGSRGVHVVTVLDRSSPFDEALRFARDVATVLVARDPGALTLETRRSKRDGRVYLDITRNAYAQTVVAPYAVRPLQGAPVAAPLRWEEVEDRRFHPRRHTMRAVVDRVHREGDPWAGMGRHARSLRTPRRLLDSILSEER